jgi:SNF2 family DNA or RNA helicase
MDVEATSEVTQPVGMKKVLLPHQLASVRMMEDLERSQVAIPQYAPESERDDGVVTFATQLGVNADITGYGKTLSMIALIMRDRREWNMDEKHTETLSTPLANGLVHKRVDRMYSRLRPTVVLASPPVLAQWEAELAQTNLVTCISSTKKELASLSDEPECDVILVSPAVFNSLVDRYHHRAWRRFVFDEPSHVRVPSMKAIVAGFTWFITATPALITSRYRNCNSNFMTGIVGKWWDFDCAFKDIILANEPEFVQASFAMPPTTHAAHTCSSRVLSSLSSIPDVVDPAILEMVSADDIGGAIRALGGNATDDLVGLLKARKQDEIDEARAKAEKYERQGREGMCGKWRERLEARTVELQKIDETTRTRLEEACPICSDPLSNPVVEPSCQNLFCGSCLVKWMRQRQTCPLCRANIVLADLVVEAETDREPKPLSGPMTKCETLASLVQDKPDGRFVVFSEFPASFDILRRTLESHEIPYAEISGDTRSQLSAIASFKNGEKPVLFLRSTENGAGLNLQCATDIVFYHNVSPLTEHQVIGRANRIGRTQALTVHTLVSF